MFYCRRTTILIGDHIFPSVSTPGRGVKLPIKLTPFVAAHPLPSQHHQSMALRQLLLHRRRRRMKSVVRPRSKCSTARSWDFFSSTVGGSGFEFNFIIIAIYWFRTLHGWNLICATFKPFSAKWNKFTIVYCKYQSRSARNNSCVLHISC